MNLKKTVSMAKTAAMTIPITPTDILGAIEELRVRSFELRENWVLVLRGRLALIEAQRGCSAWQPDGGAWLS
jgi:hypothetical protein